MKTSVMNEDVEWNAAIARYARRQASTNWLLPTSNFSISFSAFVYAFVTRMPEMLLSIAAFITALLLRRSANASRMRRRRRIETNRSRGTQAKMMSVSQILIVQR